MKFTHRFAEYCASKLLTQDGIDHWLDIWNLNDLVKIGSPSESIGKSSFGLFDVSFFIFM